MTGGRTLFIHVQIFGILVRSCNVWLHLAAHRMASYFPTSWWAVLSLWLPLDVSITMLESEPGALNEVFRDRGVAPPPGLRFRMDVRYLCLRVCAMCAWPRVRERFGMRVCTRHGSLPWALHRKHVCSGIR